MTEVMLAFEKDKKIECCYIRDRKPVYNAVIAPVWNWDDYDYQIVRIPREFIIAKQQCSSVPFVIGITTDIVAGESIRVREILEWQLENLLPGPSLP